MRSLFENIIRPAMHAVFLGLAVLGTLSVHGQNETFNIDANHSVLAFSIKIAGGFSEVEGSFDEFKGSAIVDAGTYELKQASLEIQAASINTGNDYRDNHLRTDDFFDVENYPTITFQSTSIVQDGRDVTIAGDFTMHGVTNTITIPFKRSHDQPMVWVFGEPNIIYEGTTTLSREAYKIKATSRWNSIVEASGDMAMSDEVSVRLKFITKGESPARALSAAYTEGGLDAFNATWDVLKKKYEDADVVNEGVFPSIARGFRRQDNNAGVVGVYEIWTEKYPESAEAHLNLAKAYLAVKEVSSAKASFEQALRLDPDNEEAQAALAKLN